MTPPFSGFIDSMTSRSLRRSFSLPMRFETPMCSMVGM